MEKDILKKGTSNFKRSSKRAVMFFLATLCLLLLLDNIIHEPPDQPTTFLIISMVDFYDDNLSVIFSNGIECRFVPTCSDYMRRAVLKHGSIKGAAKGLWRIVRCSPLTTKRGMDYP